MADIITRLLLKTNDFDANLNKAKGSVNQFQGGIANMAKTAGAGIMKFAGTIGIAVGAGEALMKTIRSTQATNDEFDNNLNACKDSVNSFFEALSSGDFSYFENGLMSIFQKAKDLSATLDTLGDIAIGVDVKGGQINNAVQKNLNIIRDKDSSKEEIEQAKARNQNLLAEYKKYTDKKAKVSKDALVKMYGVKAGIENPTLGDVEVYLTGGNAHMYDNAIAKYNQDLDDMDKRLKNVIHETGTAEEKSNKIVSIKNEIAAYKEEHAVIGKLGKAMNTINDEERDKLVKLRKEMDATTLSYEMLEAKIIRGDKIGEKGSNKPKIETPPPVGSLAALDAEITKQNKKLAEATTMQARAAVQATINELEQQKINLKVVVDQEAFKIKHGEMKGNKADDAGYSEQHTMFSDMLAERESALSKATDEQTKTFIQSQIDKLRETINGLNRARYELETPGNIAAKSMPKNVDYETLRGYSNKIEEMKAALSEDVSERTKASIQAEINKLETAARALAKVEGGTPGSIYEALQNNAGNKKQGSFDLRKELPNMKLPKFKSPIKKADINLNEEYAASLNSIGSIMGSLSGTFDGGAASVLQWGASILSTIAQVIPQLLALTAANQTETTSEVAGAAAKTMNAHAKIPFVGIAMGLAGVASIFSVMSQASKFATGGIVPGNSFTGDKVPAWVNSGEMILNSEQQSNLFRMLNSKLYGGLNTGRPTIEPQTGNIAALIAPNEENRKVDISGEWKVKGDTAYLQLHNYMKRTGKKL